MSRLKIIMTPFLLGGFVTVKMAGDSARGLAGTVFEGLDRPTTEARSRDPEEILPRRKPTR